jgi:hypothetical protein
LTTLLWLLVGVRAAIYLVDGGYAWYLSKGKGADVVMSPAMEPAVVPGKRERLSTIGVGGKL